MKRIVTIGVYRWTLTEWLAALRDAEVRILFDVRQRRGVRGPDYVWANSQRLQAALAGAGIAYEHHQELAPTTALRQAQYAEDDRQGVGKRNRAALAPVYAEGYTTQILDRADLGDIATALPDDGAGALFCVEADPEACHRSLIAGRLAARYGVAMSHLRPEERE